MNKVIVLTDITEDELDLICFLLETAMDHDQLSVDIRGNIIAESDISNPGWDEGETIFPSEAIETLWFKLSNCEDRLLAKAHGSSPPPVWKPEQPQVALEEHANETQK